MSGYTTVWERYPSFDDDGERRRVSESLADARMIMQMAFVAELGFRPGRITDAAGRRYPFVLADPLASDRDYDSHGFEHHDEWVAHSSTSRPPAFPGRVPAEESREPDMADSSGTDSDPSTRRPRLQMKTIMGDGPLDGAWWPESRDLGAELRTLADHWPEQLRRIGRARYSQADWDRTLRRIVSHGSIIPAASFPREDSHKIVLTMSGSRRLIELLVIPFNSSADHARLTFEAATRSGSRHTATEILAGLQPTPSRNS